VSLARPSEYDRQLAGFNPKEGHMSKWRFKPIGRGTAVAVAVLLGGGSTALATASTPDDDNEREVSVALSSPVDGASVAGGVPLEMTAEGVTIEEAGDVHDGAGHFHVIADAGCVADGDSIVRDADHVHFGAGQSEGVIYLEPGSHELCLQVGNGVHLALDITDRVTIDVGIDSLDEWCAVIDEVDKQFEAADTSEDEFAVRQVSYENIGRLIAQLDDGLDYVDPDVRDDLEESLDFTAELITAFSTAEDETTANETIDSIFARSDERFEEADDLPGTDWVADNCGIDISG
jgi:Domain of unknown function (DUF4399)